MKLQISEGLALPVQYVTERVAVLARPEQGKALAIDTPIPTLFGWKTMGEIEPGDVLFDELGDPTIVTHVTPIIDGRDCCMVEFSDGSSIVTDLEHLWKTATHASRKADVAERKLIRRRETSQRTRWPGLCTSAEIAATLLTRDKQPRLNHSVEAAGILSPPPADLPIDPYVLGAWLGDGTGQSSYITTGDSELLEEIARRGYSIGPARAHSISGNAAGYRIGAGPEGIPLTTHLRRLNLLNNKHVPAEYLRGSCVQRMHLLMGLMDTDGFIPHRENGCRFYNTSDRLADAAEELIHSFGWICRRRIKKSKLNGQEMKSCHVLCFRPTKQVFTIPRKADRFRLNVRHLDRRTRRYIKAVTPVPSVPVKCISVDSPTSMYLAGRSMIPTHNTYLASVLCEEMMEAKLHFVVIDSMGVFWGLRSSKNGNKAGYPITILGGEHGDVPLEPGGGALAADLLMESGVPIILDVSHFDTEDQRRFVASFAKQLYQLEAKAKQPLHIFLDEADTYIPNMPSGPLQIDCSGAVLRIIKQGRNYGLGLTFLTQRPQIISKTATDLCSTLICFQIIGHKSRAVLDDWTSSHGTAEQRKVFLETLAGLEVGECWIWSPTKFKLFQRIKVRERHTFDSSQTPKVGERRVEPSVLANVQLAAFQEKMSATIERAKANDPTELKKRILDLQGQLARQTKEVDHWREVAASRPETVTQIEVPVFPESYVAEIRESLREFADFLAPLQRALSVAPPRAAEAHRVTAQRPVPAPPPQPRIADTPSSPDDSSAPPTDTNDPNPIERQTDASTIRVSGPQQKILNALRSMEPVGFSSVSKQFLAVLSGVSPSSGGYSNNLGTLRSAGIIDYPKPGYVGLTETGRSLTELVEMPWLYSLPKQLIERLTENQAKVLCEVVASGHGDVPTLAEYQEAWLRKVSGPQERILRVLIDLNPDAIAKDALAEATDQSPTSGGYSNNLGYLRNSVGLIDYPNPGMVAATDLLFPEGLE